jgi:micrococcal nuclease
MSFRSLLLVSLWLILPVFLFSQSLTEGVYYPVSKHVDGDTFWVDDGSEKGAKIRLIGVDTPETRHPRKGREPYGREASRYVRDLLDGRSVRFEFDVQTKDRYGRILAYVYLEDDTFLNALLVEEGYATVATYPPNVRYAELFTELQRAAREGGLGLWGLE